LSPSHLLPGAGKAADQECFSSEDLRKFIETTRPSAAQEEESKRRGLLMLNELDGGNGKSGALDRLHCPGHVLLPERGRSAAPASGNGTRQISHLI
jgi:hypothetical protein